MKLKKTLLSAILTLTLFLSSCSKIPTNANAAFRNYTLQLFRNDVSATTLGLHYMLENPKSYGITEDPITFGSFQTSPALSLLFFENCEAALEKFSYKTLSKENQLTYDILTSYINTEKAGAKFCLYEEPLSPVTGIHAQLPVLLSDYPLNSIEDVSTYLALLKTLPDYFSSLIHFEQAKSEAGLFMSDDVLSDVLAQCNAFLSMGENNYLLTSFRERISQITEISAQEQETLCAQHGEILSQYIYPAYENLTSALTSLSGTGANSMGLCYFPEGKEYFSYLVAAETCSDKNIEEIKQRMESQVANDLLVLASITSLPATQMQVSDPIQVLKDLKEKISAAFPDSQPVKVQVKYVPEALENYLSPAFYFIPAIDNMTENIIYINQAYNLESLYLFSTLAHEGYPGHLYQTTDFASTNPDPLRQLFSFKGYVEGWATYAEMCSYYISPLKKSDAAFAQKNNSLLLGLYALADLGIHYEGWTLDDTISFFQKYGIDSKDSIQEIYSYILGDPANYLAYYVGYLEILNLKQDCKLSQKEFHQKFLEIGPAPFSVVRKYLLE